MADNFDEDDEYGKTVMTPSPFAQQKTEITPAPKAKETATKAKEPEAKRPEPSARPRVTSPVTPPRGVKRRRSPALLIALSVLLIGAAAAAAIFILGGYFPGSTPGTDTAKATAPAVAPSPQPTTAAPPTPAPAPAPSAANADLPPPAAIHVPAQTQITADKPATKPKPAPVAQKPVIEISTPAAVGGGDPAPAAHGKKSFLAVTSSLAGVKIIVDGKSVGTTPTGPIEIHPGARSVTLIAPSGAKKGYAVEVESGDTYNLSENF